MWIRERPASRANTSPPTEAPSEERLREWVNRLAIPRHRFANRRGNRLVRERLLAAFESHGLAVRTQGEHSNVVALPRGNRGAPIVLLGAHYDSVPDCPGADDNASGLAVMLECARLSQSAGVGFVAFNGEEDGLLGSRDFVTNGLAALGRHVRMMHVLEMVGCRRADAVKQDLPLPWVPAALRVPDFIGVLTKGRSNGVADAAMRSNASRALRVLTAKTWGPMHRLVPDLERSDHFPFWNAGIPAALWTDTGNFRNPNYHRPTDTPDTLDYVFLRDVAELVRDVLESETIRRSSCGSTVPRR